MPEPDFAFMSIASKLRREKAGLLLGLLLLGGAAVFYRQFLQAPPVSIRVPVLAGEIQAADGFGVKWRLPASLRAERWHRTGVRVRENGRPLPLRVAGRDRVIREGQGRFFVEPDWLWFSASDNSRPIDNHRSYEWEVQQPAYGAAVMAAILLAGAAALWSVCLPWREWGRHLLAGLSSRSPVSVPARQVLGWICGSLAGLGLVLAVWPQFLKRSIPIPAAMLMERPDGQFGCALPRWLRNDPLLVESAGLLEDRQPLRRVSLEVLKTKEAAGGFLVDQGNLLFQASDFSNPSQNGRAYRMEVCLIPAPRAWLFTLILGGAGLLLLAHMPRPASILARHPSWPGLCWWAAVGAVALGKLFVIAGDEMVAAEADPGHYAASASHLIWGDNAEFPTYPCGFPAIAGLVAQFGLPWRLALEGFYLLACYGLAASINSWLHLRWATFLLFLMAAWHPWTLSGFRNFSSEPLLVVLLMGLLAALFRVMNQPVTQWKWPAFALIGLLLFFWDWTRHEEPLVYSSYGLFVVLSVGAVRLANRHWPGHGWRIAALLSLPVLMSVTFSTAVKCVNYQRFGIYAKSLINSPGLMSLMKALYRIKPDQELRYAPVTRQSLRAACENSPSLKPYEGLLLDPHSTSTRLGEWGTKVPGEFGSFLNWLLSYSLPADHRQSNEVMQKAAREINDALEAGKLPARTAFFPLDPNWHLWIPDLLPCFWKNLQLVRSMLPAAEPLGIYQRPVLQHLFDEVANRRTANTYPGMLLADGLITAPQGSVDSVVLTDDHAMFLGASPLYTNFWNDDLIFDIRVALYHPPTNCQLNFFREGKLLNTVQVLPVIDFATNGSYANRVLMGKELLATMHAKKTVILPNTNTSLRYLVDLAWAQSDKKVRREWWERWLTYNYPTLVKGLLIAIFAGLLLSAPWERPQLWRGVACGLLALGWMVGRAALYAVVEANTGWGASPRYMQCASPVYVIILLLVTVSASALVRRFFVGIYFRRSRPEPPDGGKNGPEQHSLISL